VWVNIKRLSGSRAKTPLPLIRSMAALVRRLAFGKVRAKRDRRIRLRREPFDHVQEGGHIAGGILVGFPVNLVNRVENNQ